MLRHYVHCLPFRKAGFNREKVHQFVFVDGFVIVHIHVTEQDRRFRLKHRQTSQNQPHDFQPESLRKMSHQYALLLLFGSVHSIFIR